MSAIAFAVALGVGVVAPAIPLLSKHFGLDAAAAGLIVSSFSLVRLIFGPLGGGLADRMGERCTLIVGLVVVALSSLLAGLSANFSQLLVFRAVGGIGSALFTVAATVLVIRAASAHVRGRAMGMYHAGFMAGGIAGPAAGGAVLAMSLRAPFFLYAGIIAIAILIAVLALRRSGSAAPQAAGTSEDPGARGVGEGGEAQESSAEAQTTELRFSEAFRSPSYVSALASNLTLGFTIVGMRSVLVPLLLTSMGTGPQWIGAALGTLAAVEVIVIYPAGHLTDTVGRRFGVLTGSLLCAIGMAALIWVPNPVMVIADMVVLGIGSAFLSTAPGALAADALQGRGGRMVAGFQMPNDLGVVLGPLTVGLLVDHGSFGLAFAVGAGSLVVCGSLALRIQPDVPSASRK
ncbi:MFS transporter [Streptomyces vastus]|uniref:MFS transporter n=1 Tax=Streptomyces vastus TaxID=285451 RepID=A0ABN3QZY8_9ACTN